MKKPALITATALVAASALLLPVSAAVAHDNVNPSHMKSASVVDAKKAVSDARTAWMEARVEARKVCAPDMPTESPSPTATPSESESTELAETEDDSTLTMRPKWAGGAYAAEYSDACKVALDTADAKKAAYKDALTAYKDARKDAREARKDAREQAKEQWKKDKAEAKNEWKKDHGKPVPSDSPSPTASPSESGSASAAAFYRK